MRKIICVLLVVIMIMCFTACGNESWGMGNYEWHHIHFTDMVEGHCATISKWHDNETGIEVETVENGSMFLGEGSYIMFDSASNCPYCENKQ